MRFCGTSPCSAKLRTRSATQPEQITPTSAGGIRFGPANYTANKAKYATTPAAVVGFDHLKEGFDKGWYNEDYLSAKFDAGPVALADGTAAQYPMLTFALGSIDPAKAQNVGFFGAKQLGLPGW